MRIIAVLLFISACAGLAAVSVLPQYPVISDSAHYDTIAQGLLEHKTFIPADGIYWPPGYPTFLAFVYALFGHSYKAVYFVQFLLVGAIASLVYLIGRNHLNLPAFPAFLAALAVLFWPYFMLYPMLLMGETLFTFLLVLSAYFLLNFHKNHSYQNAALAGALLGLATLTRPVALLLLPWVIFFVIALLRRRLPDRQHMLKIGTMLLIFLCVLAPWILFLWAHTGTFAPVSTQLPYVFEKANKTLGYAPDTIEPVSQGETSVQKVIAAKIKNIYLFWNPGAGGYQADALTTKFSFAKYILVLYEIVFFAMLAFAFLSLRFWKTKEVALLWIIIFYFWAVHTALFPFPRYTLPVIPLVLLLAFLSLTHYYRALKTHLTYERTA